MSPNLVFSSLGKKRLREGDAPIREPIRALEKRSFIMAKIIKKNLSIHFNPKDLIGFANSNFKEREKISGFNEEVLIGLFLLKWFKDGKRKDSNFSIGFKYKVEHESELEDLLKHNKLSPALFSKRFADQNTLSDLIIKSSTEKKN